MKIIISESQNKWLLRRIGMIENSVKTAMKIVDPNDYSLNDYIDEICWQVVDDFRNEPADESVGVIDEIMSYVKHKYYDFLVQYYFEMSN